MKIPFKEKNLTTFLIIFCVLMIISSIFIQKKRQHLQEVKKLPFYNVKLEDVQDGIYTNKTYTSFMHTVLQVTVQNHQIKDITIIENSGSQGRNVEPIIKEMIIQNKALVSAIPKEEIASLVLISCVDGALKQGVIEANE